MMALLRWFFALCILVGMGGLLGIVATLAIDQVKARWL